MRPFTLFGLRVMTERDWNLTIDDAARDRAIRLQLEEELKTVVAAAEQFADDVKGATSQNRETIRGAISTVLGCNVRLARRAEVAELEAEQLRSQLTEVLRQP